MKRVTSEDIEQNMGLVHLVVNKKFPRRPVGFTRDDLVAFGMEGLHRALQTFDPARGLFGSYAFTVIRQAILNGIRDFRWGKSRPFYPLSLDALATEGSTLGALQDPSKAPEAVAIRSDTARRVWDAVGRDPDSQIVRRHVHGEAHAEIGEELGIGKSAVSARYRRALGRLARNPELRGVA